MQEVCVLLQPKEEVAGGGKPRFYRRTSFRVLAVMMAVVILLSLAVGILGNVRIRQEALFSPDGDIQAANNYLAEHSEFIEQDYLSRAFYALGTDLSRPRTFLEHYRRAEVLIAREDYKGALQSIGACLQLYQGTDEILLLDLWMKKGCLQAMLGAYEQALESIDKAIETAPGQNLVEAHLVRAQVCLLLGDINGALDSLGYYLEQAPQDVEAHATVAELYLAMGRYEEALACYDVVLNYGEPGTHAPALFLGQATGYLMADDIPAAMEALEQYEQQVGGTDAQSSFLRGMCSQQQQEFEEARGWFEKAVALGHMQPSVCYEQIVQCWFFEGNFEEVLAVGQLALESGDVLSNPQMFHRQMGVAAMALGLLPEAAASFSLAVSYGGPDSASDRYYRGICRMALGELEGAVADFSVAIEAGIEPQLSYYYRGLCYLELEKLEEALADFNAAAALTEDPETQQAAAELAELLEEELAAAA